MPALMMPYRAKLSGIISVLFVLHWLTLQTDILLQGASQIYCDNESALEVLFSLHRPTNNPYTHLAANKDLITLCHALLTSLPACMKVNYSWVKGHYKGTPKLKHHPNMRADKLATKFNAIIRKHPTSMPALQPTHDIELLHGSAQITSRVSQMVIIAQHTSAIEAYITKRANWSKKFLT